jgi:hypothetical protein
MKRDTIPCGPPVFCVLSTNIPLHTVSEANRASHEHWRKRHKRAKGQREVAKFVISTLLRIRPEYGRDTTVVTLTRIAPRKLDTDNLQGALKAVRDGVADALGIDDGAGKVAWAYGQEKGRAKEYAVRVDLGR